MEPVAVAGRQFVGNRPGELTRVLSAMEAGVACGGLVLCVAVSLWLGAQVHLSDPDMKRDAMFVCLGLVVLALALFVGFTGYAVVTRW